MFNLLNEKESKFFCERWKKYVLDDFPGCDKRIKRSLVQLSIMPGLVPMWSCSGHTLKEQSVLNRKFYVAQTRYIIFGVYKDVNSLEETHTLVFERFEKWYRNLNLKTFRSFRPRLETTFLTNRSEPGEYTISPVWKLSFNYKLQYKEGLLGVDPTNLEVEWDKLISFLTEYN